MRLIKIKFKKYRPKIASGLTLIELLLSMATIATLAAITILVFQSFQSKNDLDLAVVTVAQTFRRAQILAQAVDTDIGWGIYVQAGSITLFKGSTYATRDSNYDEIFSIPSTITPSGTQEFDVNKFTGYPVATGNLTLTSVTGDAKTISINSYGTVSY